MLTGACHQLLSSLLSAGLIALGFAQVTLAADEVATRVEIQDGEILYDGKIDHENVMKFMALYERMQVKPVSFTIRSMGGSGNSGLDLAEFVYAHGLSIRVLDYCHSSCSNFVFIAARQKVLAHDAIVAWHSSPVQQAWQIAGRKEPHRCASAQTCAAEVAHAAGEALKCQNADPCPDERAQYERELFATLDSQIRRMRALYTATSVDTRMTTYGVERDCYCEWTFSIEDMRKFNISDLTVDKHRRVSDFSWQGRKQALDLRARLKTFTLP
jgi:hypothetical protein